MPENAVMSRPKKPPTETVRISKEAARKARIASAASGESLPDWMTRIVEEAADAEIDEFAKDHVRDSKKKKIGD